jgi:hypothetical protein
MQLSHIPQHLDDIGKPAWIALMIVGFIVFWPIGLAILGFLIWSGRMGCGRQSHWERWSERRERFFSAVENRSRLWAAMNGCCSGRYGPSSGNRAFDEYRAETLRRLEDEQREFTAFLDRLRRAKDKAEFDQFMNDLKQRPDNAPPESQ